MNLGLPADNTELFDLLAKRKVFALSRVHLLPTDPRLCDAQ